MNIQIISKECKELLQRILESSITDKKIPKDQIGEEKEYHWRASSINHEPILINSVSGKIVGGAGTEAREQAKAKETSAPLPTVSIKITANNRPPNTDTNKAKIAFWDTFAQKFNEAIDNGRVSDSSVVFLYSTLSKRQAVKKFTMDKVGNAKIVTSPDAIYDLKITDLNQFPYTMGTALHELGHYIDYTDLDEHWASARKLTKALAEVQNQEMPSELITEILSAHKKKEKYMEIVKALWDNEAAKIKQQLVQCVDEEESYELSLQYETIKAKRKAEIHAADMNYWGRHGNGMEAVSDICDAISKGELQEKKNVYGHGTKYYANDNKRAREIWANYCDLAILHPKTLNMLEKYYPQIVKACRDMSKELEEMWRAGHRE